MTGSALVSLARFAGRTGRGVRIAVVDSGIHAAHPHVGGISGGIAIDADGKVAPGFDDRLGHGTAVAAAIREKATEAALIAVKVFDRTLATTAQALATAIEWSAHQDVALINLSLGSEFDPADPQLSPDDELLRAAIEDARALGTVAIAAAGNDDRSPVNFPGRDDLCIAVSAVGRKGTFPASSTEGGDVASPFGKDKKDFVAAFSNIGRITRLDGTNWTTIDAKGIWRASLGGLHEVSFGAHGDRYDLVNPTYQTPNWQGSADSTSTLYSNALGKTQTLALWAQDAWRFAPQWKLTVGGRWESWRAFDGFNLATTTNATSTVSNESVRKAGTKYP